MAQAGVTDQFLGGGETADVTGFEEDGGDHAVEGCRERQLRQLGITRHELLWFLFSDFSLDAGFQPCTWASIRLSPRTIHPNHFFAAFLACVGWLFGCTIV